MSFAHEAGGLEFRRARDETRRARLRGSSGRIAVFENDGTLWSEHPIDIQFGFALDRVRELAPQHPEWKTKQSFKSMLAGDLKSELSGGEKVLLREPAIAHINDGPDKLSRSPHAARPPHRRSARGRLRPHVAHRKARQGPSTSHPRRDRIRRDRCSEPVACIAPTSRRISLRTVGSQNATGLNGPQPRDGRERPFAANPNETLSER